MQKMERMIKDHLTWFLEANNIKTDYQSGFRRHRNTNDHLVRLETFIREAFIKKEHLNVFYLIALTSKTHVIDITESAL